jgi:hypothetical protein
LSWRFCILTFWSKLKIITTESSTTKNHTVRLVA